MKRIKSACLLQTVHFQLKENLPSSAAVRNVQEEYENYKKHLDHTRTRYQILNEEVLPDGSILIEIKKQYNNQDCGKYFDEN